MRYGKLHTPLNPLPREGVAGFKGTVHGERSLGRGACAVRPWRHRNVQVTWPCRRPVRGSGGCRPDARSPRPVAAATLTDVDSPTRAMKPPVPLRGERPVMGTGSGRNWVEQNAASIVPLKQHMRLPDEVRRLRWSEASVPGFQGLRDAGHAPIPAMPGMPPP